MKDYKKLETLPKALEGNTNETRFNFSLFHASIYELETQLLISSDLGYVSQETFNIILVKIETCKKLLNGFINYYKSLSNGRQPTINNQ